MIRPGGKTPGLSLPLSTFHGLFPPSVSDGWLTTYQVTFSDRPRGDFVGYVQPTPQRFLGPLL